MDDTAGPDGSDQPEPAGESAPDAAIDWTGVQPDRSPIRPLDDQTFLLRLRLLTERAASLTRLRQAFLDQRSDGQQLPRDPEPAPRRSR
jgi:hypothetical protein